MHGHRHRLVASATRQRIRTVASAFDMRVLGFGMWKSLDIHLTGQNTGRWDVVLLQIVAKTFSRPFQLSVLWWT